MCVERDVSIKKKNYGHFSFAINFTNQKQLNIYTHFNGVFSGFYLRFDYLVNYALKKEYTHTQNPVIVL